MESACQIRLIQYRAAALALCAALIVAGLTAGVAYADPALDEYNVAVGLYKQNRWTLAAEKFQAFVDQYPQHVRRPNARLYLGLTLIQLDQFNDARDVLRVFVKDYPDSKNLPHAMYRVAETSYLLDDLKSAETEFQAFLTKSPDDPLREWAYPYLADTQLRLAHAEAAAENFRKSLELYPNGVMAEDAKFGLARSLETLKKSPEAIELYRQLADTPSGSRAPQAQFNLATVRFESGEYQLAINEFAMLVEKFPESDLLPLARLNSGYSFYQLHDYQAALNQFALVQTSEKHAKTALYWTGLSRKALTQYPQAAEALQAAFEAKGDDTPSEEILFHWADSELRGARFETAGELFRDFVTRWPQHKLADESLHFAAEATLARVANSQPTDRPKLFETAEQLAVRFETEFPNSELKWMHKILRGRLFDAWGQSLESQGNAAGSTDKATAAVGQFQEVLSSSTDSAAQTAARLHLAKIYQRTERHADAIAVLTPLLEQLKQPQADPSLVAALILSGRSLLVEKQYDAVVAASNEYLQRLPSGELADQALATKAQAEAHRGKSSDAKATLAKLASEHPQSPEWAATTHALAELAYANHDWTWSEELFRSLAENASQPLFQAIGLSGRAWSQFQQAKYEQAANAFSRVVKEFPQHPLVPEAAYKTAESWQKAGQLDQAEAAGVAAVKLTQGSPFAVTAARHYARLLRDLKKTDESDAAYKTAYETVTALPKDQQSSLDTLLEEWAMLHYEAEHFTQADDLFQRIIDEAPSSPLVPYARFSLAESQLIAGKLDDAKRSFDELLATAKSGDDVKRDSLFRLMGIASEQEDSKRVVELVQQLRDTFPNSAYEHEATFYLAEAQLRLNQLRPAQASLLGLKSLKDDPSVSRAHWFAHVWVLLAEVAFQQMDYSAVTATVSEFQSWDPMSQFLYRAHEVLGRAYKQQAKFDEARDALKKVVESPDGRRTETAAKSQFLIAESYLIQKDFKNALSEYLKVYYLYNKFPDWQATSLFQAAACDEQLGQWQSAVKSYDSLLKEFPDSEFAAKSKPRLEAARRRAAESKSK